MLRRVGYARPLWRAGLLTPVLVGLLEGASWAFVSVSTYIPVLSDFASGPAFIPHDVWSATGTALFVAAFCAVPAVGLRAALDGPAGRAPRRVARTTLLVVAGFVVLGVVVRAAVRAEEFSVPIMALGTGGFATSGLAALVAAMIWRRVVAPTPEGDVRPPAARSLLVAVALVSAACGWSLQLVRDVGGHQDLTDLIVGPFVIAVAVLALCGAATLVARRTGWLPAWSLAVAVGIAVGILATDWTLRPRPASWNLVGVGPDGRTLLIRVRPASDCDPGTASAAVIRRTRAVIEVEARRTPARSSNPRCQMMVGFAEDDAITLVSLDQPVTGERITGPLVRRRPTGAQIRQELGRLGPRRMPSVVGLRPADARSVLGGADPDLRLGGERLTYRQLEQFNRYRNRLGNVRFEPSARGLMVTAQRPAAGAIVSGWSRDAATGAVRPPRYGAIVLTTGDRAP